MSKLIWMSDLHFTCEDNVLGHNPRVRLQAAIDHINQHHSDASFCVISGDMVNHGTENDYTALQILLDSLAIPVFPMVGNHDDRGIFKNHLTVPDTCMTKFVQYTVAMDTGLVICVDTKKIGSDSGEICSERLNWLHNELINAGNTPVFIFMHHPPMKLGLPVQDPDNLENGESFMDMISPFSCVKHLFIGHVHRPIVGTERGIPFATMRSVLFQAPPPRPEWNWDTFKPSEEPPNLGVITITGSSVNLQYEQFCNLKHGATD